jgi:2'-5' RNA ligase
MKNAHSFPEVYKSLGINLNSLGCLMLTTENPLKGKIPEEGQYISPDPEKFWMKGALKEWHVTVRYGFLPSVKREHVKAVLSDMDKPRLLIASGFEVFPSTIPDEDYECVVMRVSSSHLQNMHKQLSVLPNIETFPTYKPHVTLGYFKSGWFHDNKDSIIELRKGLIEADEFDYGKNL